MRALVLNDRLDRFDLRLYFGRLGRRRRGLDRFGLGLHRDRLEDFDRLLMQHRQGTAFAEQVAVGDKSHPADVDDDRGHKRIAEDAVGKRSLFLIAGLDTRLVH